MWRTTPSVAGVDDVVSRIAAAPDNTGVVVERVVATSPPTITTRQESSSTEDYDATIFLLGGVDQVPAAAAAASEIKMETSEKKKRRLPPTGQTRARRVGRVSRTMEETTTTTPGEESVGFVVGQVGEGMPLSLATTAAVTTTPPFRAHTKHEEKWNEMFDKLQAYKLHFKSTLVPQCYDQDVRLGRWVHYQRGTCICVRVSCQSAARWKAMNKNSWVLTPR
jgi:hypothetical protein